MPFRPIPAAVVRARPEPAWNEILDIPQPPPVDLPRTIAYRNGFMFGLGNLDRRAAMFCKNISRGLERIFRGSNLRHEEFRCRTALLDARVISNEEFGGECSKLLARAMNNLYHQKYGEEFASSPAIAADAHYLASREAAAAVMQTLRRVERPSLSPNSTTSAWLEFHLRLLSEPRPPLF